MNLKNKTNKTEIEIEVPEDKNTIWKDRKVVKVQRFIKKILNMIK